MVRKVNLCPIVEFFPLYDYTEHSHLFFDTKAKHQQALRDQLLKAQGVYAFYNSEGEIIYIGKTEKQTLWARMKKSCNANSRYSRYYVKYPHSRFVAPRNGRVRKIVKDKFGIWNVAEFCSAYVVPKDLIAFLEQALIRLLPNDLINLKMEGNMTLRTADLDSLRERK